VIVGNAKRSDIVTSTRKSHLETSLTRYLKIISIYPLYDLP